MEIRSFAWYDTGHKIVAAIAYNELTPDEQADVDDILKKHINYQTWLGDFAQAHNTVQLGQFIFMQASTWPDEIRDNQDPTTHPEWHYVDYPLIPPGFAEQPAPKPNDDVVFAIGKSKDVLEDIHARKRRQAEYLSWLIHLVGDIHQPLHCSSLFNDTFKGKEGDRGGNNFYVKMKSTSANPAKLHGLWDGLPGTGNDPDNLAKKARDWAQAHARSDFPAATFTAAPSDWSKESRRLASETVYRPLPSLDGTKSHPVVLPDGYFNASKNLAEKQVTLAGYRLADEIKTILAVRGVNP